MSDWEHIFKQKGTVFLKPQESMPKIIDLFKQRKVKNILDLGCGSGRHVVMFAKAGFDVSGTDISKEGLKLTRCWLEKSNLTAKLKLASCYEKFPFTDNFFDAIISTQVIHHNYHDKIVFCIGEINRILKKGGLAFITVASHKGGSFSKDSKLKLVAPETYIPLDGPEQGTPHYNYTLATLKQDFHNFEILNLHTEKDGNHYCILVEKK